MIVDSIAHAERYRGLGAGIDVALDYLKQCAEQRIPEDGVHEVFSDVVRAVVVSRETLPYNDTKMEIHKEYMDIHYVSQGVEGVGFSPSFHQRHPYDVENDIAIGYGDDEAVIILNPGWFALVWPEEAHRPLIAPGGNPQSIKKVIMKVRIEKNNT